MDNSWKYFYCKDCPLSMQLLNSFSSFCKTVDVGKKNIAKEYCALISKLPALISEENTETSKIIHVYEGKNLYNWIETQGSEKQDQDQNEAQAQTQDEDQSENTTSLFTPSNMDASVSSSIKKKTNVKDIMEQMIKERNMDDVPVPNER